jgi:hypothetical protein
VAVLTAPTRWSSRSARSAWGPATGSSGVQLATAEAVVAGGVPVFADIEPASFNLDPEDAAAPPRDGRPIESPHGRPFDAHQ